MRVARLADVCEINPRSSSAPSKEGIASFFKMASISEAGCIAHEDTMPLSGLRSGYTRFERGDILLAKITPCFENGKAARTDNIKYPFGVGSTEFHVIRASSEVLTDYIFHMVWNPTFRRIATLSMTGSAGQRRVPTDFLKRLEIPLPSLDEQRRIACILDTLQDIVRKRLRSIELVEEFCRSKFDDMFGVDVFERKETCLDEIITRIDSGWSPSCLDRASELGESGILKLNSISSGRYDDTANKALPATLSPRPSDEVRAEDILICRKNTLDLVGSSAYVWQTKPNVYISDLIFRIVPDKNKVDPIFLQSLIGCHEIRDRIAQLAGGTAGSMPNVSKANLRSLKLFIPDMKDQVSYSSFAKKAHSLRIKMSEYLNRTTTLQRNAQRAAFEGRL